MNCRLCHTPGLLPLPFEVPTEAGQWFHCPECGSHLAGHEYPREIYSQKFEQEAIEHGGGKARMREQVRSNCDWFVHHHHAHMPRTFLDVGCCDGAALTEMQDVHGFAIHGFEVFEPTYMGPHVTVAPVFNRWLFPRRYSAILCREVIEHVEFPQHLLRELHGACEPGGLVQIQTPRPMMSYRPDTYQISHLFIPSVFQMKRMIAEARLQILGERIWPEGQAYLTRTL